MSVENRIISVVAPFYNEGEMLDLFYDRISKVLKSIAYEYEIIYINDGSNDNSLEIVQQQKNNDKKITIIDLSRNYGKEIAMTAGLDYCLGDAAVIIDTDLQDPPEVIPEMIKHWEQGNEVIYAVRRSRAGETIFKKLTAHIYYRILKMVSDTNIPRDTGDFRLLDRSAINAVISLRERHRYMKGIFAWVGYKQKAIFYDRDSRYAGTTKWSVRKLIHLATEGLTSFSVIPLRVASYAGLITALLSTSYGIYIISKKIIYDDPVTGYPSLIAVITFIGSMQLIALGIIGEYLGRVFNETKQRPLYFIKSIKPSSTNKE